MSYDFYIKFFRKNLNFRFDLPQVNTCYKCESLNLKIKSPDLNDLAKRTARLSCLSINADVESSILL